MPSNTIWPKVPPVLTQEQQQAREKFMMAWHQELPQKYGLVENFNHGFPARLEVRPGSKTLEIGAGIGEHSRFEDLKKQDYFVLEYREEFCTELRKIFPEDHVFCGDIQQKQPWKNQEFDRIIAVHVLEHLPNLPLACQEIHRLLKDDGYFDIVIPTEGSLAYTLARKVSAERFFRKQFKMDYTPIIRNEHVSTFDEIKEVLGDFFQVRQSSYFPLIIPAAQVNLCVGFRLTKKR